MKASLALLAVGTLVAAGCGGSSNAAATYRGHSRTATVVLTVNRPKKQRPATWTLSIRFTPSGAHLRHLLHTSLLNAFCAFPTTLVESGLGSYEIRPNGVELTRAVTFPIRGRITCGLRDANPAKGGLAGYLATAPLAVRLRRQ